MRHEWYWDEKWENEFDVKISNFEKEEFAKDFVENAVIKIFSHSFRLFLTISLWLCSLNQINTKSRKQSNNRINKSDSRYWCWRCRICCTKFTISQNRSNFWISHRRVASKKSISAATKVDLTIFKTFNSTRLTISRIFNSVCLTTFFMVFEISSFAVSSCKTSEQSSDFWKCFLYDFLQSYWNIDR